MKKKGFTLIELLAVIVILAIIALIAVPVIMNIISSARESAFKDTMYGVVKAGELYYAERLLEGEIKGEVTFTFSENGVSPSGLNIKGSLPTSGTMTITKEGKIILNATDGTFTATKDANSTEINVVKGGELEETPEAPTAKTLKDLAKTNDFAESVDACATSGICAVGTKFAIEVAPNNLQNFYVVSDVNNKVTLIMDRNIGNRIAWTSDSDFSSAGGKVTDEMLNDNGSCQYDGDCIASSEGPITALNYLESQTSSWTNIPVKNYTLQDTNEPKLYPDMEITGTRARMLTKTEAEAIISNLWAYDNLDEMDGPYGYWISSAASTRTAKSVDIMAGNMSSININYDSIYGVRPVIELSK